MKSIPLGLYGEKSKSALFRKKLEIKLNVLSKNHMSDICRYSDSILMRSVKIFEHFENNGYKFKQLADCYPIYISNPYLNVYKENEHKYQYITLPDVLKIMNVSHSDPILDKIIDNVSEEYSKEYILNAKDNAIAIISNGYNYSMSQIVDRINENFGKNDSFRISISPHFGCYYYNQVIEQIIKNTHDAGYKFRVIDYNPDHRKMHFCIEVL